MYGWDVSVPKYDFHRKLQSIVDKIQVRKFKHIRIHCVSWRAMEYCPCILFKNAVYPLLCSGRSNMSYNWSILRSTGLQRLVNTCSICGQITVLLDASKDCNYILYPQRKLQFVGRSLQITIQFLFLITIQFLFLIIYTITKFDELLQCKQFQAM